jgi:hypothetical protein
MTIGTRVVHQEEIGVWNAELLQISIYCEMKDNIEIMKDCVYKCRDMGIRYVIHPVSYSLLQKDLFKELLKIAEFSDIALILHDERTPESEKLIGQYETQFRDALKELKSITDISFENATDTRDVQWFWENYAESITLDIGHVESSGLNSVEFVKSLNKDCIQRVQFVHIHRNNIMRGGITDHWPLTPDCRELRALKELIKIKPDVGVILEINEINKIGDNIRLLNELRQTLRI